MRHSATPCASDLEQSPEAVLRSIKSKLQVLYDGRRISREEFVAVAKNTFRVITSQPTTSNARSESFIDMALKLQLELLGIMWPPPHLGEGARSFPTTHASTELHQVGHTIQKSPSAVRWSGRERSSDPTPNEADPPPPASPPPPQAKTPTAFLVGSMLSDESAARLVLQEEEAATRCDTIVRFSHGLAALAAHTRTPRSEPPPETPRTPSRRLSDTHLGLSTSPAVVAPSIYSHAPDPYRPVPARVSRTPMPRELQRRNPLRPAATKPPSREELVDAVRRLLQPAYNAGMLSQEGFAFVARHVSTALAEERHPKGTPWEDAVALHVYEAWQLLFPDAKLENVNSV